ncbi:GNAT family N-acetyltransferase [Pararobbsia silviterrae]|uniref:GNAT family N-acetyltransferase n=1 Tax=Pararobbsia silviterrae TaxID=1792498 RepID=A0A494X934_9BURK|nr:GNAT family N-acetyltransferase [Pararobbsia silviterrae]RKP47078.1 GNAT family N-acetyltransferase [Pararobbsia silviterrae]
MTSLSDSAVAERATGVEEFVYVAVDDPRAQPLFEELSFEYRTRYADRIRADEIEVELHSRYPAELFVRPTGAFVLLLRDGQAIAGGAFMAHEQAGTTEFKRIWTSRHHRRQGLAHRILVELEAEAVRQGYTRVFLGTGPRQPEAIALYQSHGYTLLSAHDFDEAQPPGYLFEKYLEARV